MMKCKICSNQFKWGNIIKSIWFTGWGYAPIVCGSCGTKHYVNLSTRLIIAFSFPAYIVLICVLPTSIFENYLLIAIILFYLIWITIIICITPLFARYHIKHGD